MSCPATGDARILGVGAPPTGAVVVPLEVVRDGGGRRDPTRRVAGVQPRVAVAVADGVGGAGAAAGHRAVPGARSTRLAAGVSGHRRRCPGAADRHHRDDGDGHRAAARAGRGGPAAVVDPVLPSAVAQLSARPPEPDRAQRVRRHLRLQHRGLVRGRGVGWGTQRRVPPLRGDRCGGAAVRQPGAAGVLRRPPRALTPGRPHHARRRAQHPARHPSSAHQRREPFGERAAAGAALGDPGSGPGVRIRADRAPRAAAGRGRGAAGERAGAAADRRARRRRHATGLDLAGRPGTPGSAGAHVQREPGRRGADRLRTHPRAGPRPGAAPARRPRMQGVVPGGQRPLHGDPGRRTPVRAVRRARRPPARPDRRPRPHGRGHRRRAGAVVSPSTSPWASA